MSNTEKAQGAEPQKSTGMMPIPQENGTENPETQVAKPETKELSTEQAMRSEGFDFKTSVDQMMENRAYLKEKIFSILIEGTDFHIIKNKKSLGKPGAEKLATIWRLVAKFEVDKPVLELFSKLEGVIPYKCILADYNGKYMGEGGGASMLKENAQDPNKTIKMARKRAFVDAVIRVTGLSDIFTQDIEDMDPNLIDGQDRKTAPPRQSNRPNYQPNTQGGQTRSQGKTSGPYIKNPTAPISFGQKNMLRKLIADLGQTELNFEQAFKKKIDHLNMGDASKLIERFMAQRDGIKPGETPGEGGPDTVCIDPETGKPLKY